jgi:hypothetical protein
MTLLLLGINWPQLNALNEIYETGRTKVMLFSNSYIRRLRQDKRLLRYKNGNQGIIEASGNFKEFYQANFLKSYTKYIEFFKQTEIEHDGRRSYSMYDLETLMYIHDKKQILSENLTTQRSFSAQLFKGSKYLENNTSVLKAVYKILNIKAFPKSDPKVQKWRLVIDCTNPRAIILCENLAALKYPDIAIALSIELWYVGGNNTTILENIASEKINLPFYYMCDWDYDGLRIFGNVKRIIAKKGKLTKLLMPFDQSKRLPVDSPYHSSEWKVISPLSGLSQMDFTEDQCVLIAELNASNQWIEEESQDFEQLLIFNNVLLQS